MVTQAPPKAAILVAVFFVIASIALSLFVWSSLGGQIPLQPKGYRVTAPFPEHELGTPRGRQGSPRKRVVLPDGWLDDTDGRGAHLREDVDETTGG